MLPAKSLYIHIPFCRSKCSYCDFFSVPCGGVEDSYIGSLVNELNFHVRLGVLKDVETVYVGGGTPTLLSAFQLELLLKSILPLCSCNPEITVEANPDSLTCDFVRVMRQNSVNRVSLGVQSLDDAVLSFVGRRGNADCCRNALKLLQKNDMPFSVDMIAGLPSHEDKVFQDGLKELVAYNPDHVSLYSLTVEQGTPLERLVLSGKLDYSEDRVGDQWIAGRDLLESMGYMQYEVSNFCLPGKESRHNMAYWNQLSYVGLGSGATGSLYFSDKAAGSLLQGLRYTNDMNIDLYMKFWLGQGKTLPAYGSFEEFFSTLPLELEVLDSETLSFEFLMLGLRTKKGISCMEYNRRFSRKIDTALFERYRKRSLVDLYQKEGDDYYAMTREGLLFLNGFLAEL